jgi:xanthine dehydrogenase accessory factor
MRSIYEHILKLEQNKEQGALVLIVASHGSTPRKAGSKMIVKPDGSIIGTVGGGALEKKLIEEALEVIRAGEGRFVHHSLLYELGMCCGGQVDAYIEPLNPMKTFIIFGAGHVGATLAKIAKMQGFHIVVVDERPEFANEEHIPEANVILNEHHRQAYTKLKFDVNTYVVIVTHEHRYDKEILEYVVSQPAAYIGMIGSRRKVLRTVAMLKEKGVDEELLKRAHMPIGLNIGAETPEEIAVSIMAEIIAVMRGGTGGFMGEYQRQKEVALIEEVVERVDE